MTGICQGGDIQGLTMRKTDDQGGRKHSRTSFGGFKC